MRIAGYETGRNQMRIARVRSQVSTGFRLGGA